MVVAIIDLGTNTFNLLISEINSDKEETTLFETKISVKLGEGGINKKNILPVAFERGIEALKKYKTIIETYKAEKIIAFATSAIREASNGNDFIYKAQQETGITVQAISGNEEAEYIYYGVRDAVKFSDKHSLIMDIGGGSTEFIIADRENIIWKQSYLLGAARLLEKFNPSDPIKKNEIKKIEDYLRQELSSLLEAVRKFGVTELVGSSGSFDSLAEMIAYKFYSLDILKNKTEYLFNIEECAVIYKQILRSTKAERIKIKGLVEMRVDMIVVSSIFVNFIFRELNLKKMRLSAFSLKEGVLWKFKNNIQ